MGSQLGRTMPAGSTKADAVASLQANGQSRMADLISGMDVVPGRGLDTGALQRAMLLVLAVYLLASLFAWGQAYLMAGVTQRAVFELREQVDHKLGRLPLAHFDTHARGDVLSRVTNDIDNISTTLQQSLTQLITSTATVLGVLVLMFVISPLLALVSLISVPASFALIMVIAKRAQPQFAAQWKWTGTLNGHIEETFTGHELVRLYGRRRQALTTFEASNDELYASSFKAQFVSGLTMPAMMVISNLAYVAIAVLGGLRVASGTMSLGDVQAFIQYSRQFTHADRAAGLDRQRRAVGHRLGRARLRAARRARGEPRPRPRRPPRRWPRRLPGARRRQVESTSSASGTARTPR